MTATKTTTRTINVPLNRVEGDLEVRVELDGGVVTDAWSAGTMYRGIENMLVGRGAYDGLVITPRVCGICGTAHLTAAARALDAISGAAMPRNGQLARNLALMTESMQSDLRHGILMFMADFTNSAYAGSPLHDEAVARFAPFKGASVVETVAETRSLLEIVALIGGQWPHSSYMVPGGVTTNLKTNEIFSCQYLLDRFQRWYERRILGCSVDRWRQVASADDLDAWLDEKPEHRDGDLGFFIRFAREAGLERLGGSHGNFLSFGQLEIPADSQVRGADGRLLPAGFYSDGRLAAFDQAGIAEHVAHSWYEDYDGGRHPFQGATVPYASGAGRSKYSWAKAPRYEGLPAETGPLAELVVAARPLFRDLIRAGGPNAFARELARLVRPAEMFDAMRLWLDEIDTDEPFYAATPRVEDGRGFGLIEAARGALGHWVEIAAGRIEHYQMITPTAWNCSPRDSDGVRGPWEEALVGTAVADEANPVELGHIVRSFDACLVCCVHAVRGPRTLAKVRV